ncbi:hypothetical protein L5515_015338 [Caenorhabditis briggsae]|uniref:Uncharacterized protein n=1 Tax=Caenorhabditis briggsae TaxID=6238 RepID=A0AAE9EDW9_CAEBR|nr:hypothetical protein L5515_015338 [Caenorhabditis briggsae]
MILSALTDIHLTILMKPIPLTPLFAGYTVGIMPKNLDISAHHCAILTGFIAVSQLETLILCFARMHQVIALVLNTHVVPRFLQYSCYALCVLCPIALCGSDGQPTDNRRTTDGQPADNRHTDREYPMDNWLTTEGQPTDNRQSKGGQPTANQRTTYGQPMGY